MQGEKNKELFEVMADERSDEELMARIVKRDEEAFRTLIERHQDRVYGTVARMMGGVGPEAEEVAQDVFLRIWKSAGTYRAEGKFTSWLMMVVRNQVFTRLGQRKRRKDIDGRDLVDEETGESLLERQADSGARAPSEELSLRELQKAVEEACLELPENQRLIVHLRQYEGLEFEEIGKITGQSLTAVKALMFRAREKETFSIFERIQLTKTWFNSIWR
ncbi:MAG: sigma-70 family RNA polymerase sigma factor [Verrucomicrobia bacterium]|nr:sigma-70 family RNA polymerase sigma factor [Verrucomicrobiota bacterium]